MLPSIHARYDDNILIGGSVSSDPDPMATYDIDTLMTHRPGDRVRWGAPGSPDDYRIRFVLGGGSPTPEQRADVLVIPCSNIDGTLTLESDAGMNVAIALPTSMPSGIPRTIAADLTLLDTNATHRTSGAFDLVINGNSENLIMGGAVLLYGPKRTFEDRDWRFGFTRAMRSYVVRHDNEYGTDLVSTLRTRTRSIAVSTLCTDAEALDLEEWADANFGSGLPGLIWPIPDVYEAYFGRLEDVHTQTIKVEGANDAVEVSLTFTEISKGKPVA